MLAQLSSQEGIPETSVKVSMRPFMTAAVTFRHFLHFFPFTHPSVEPEVKLINSILERLSSHVQVQTSSG